MTQPIRVVLSPHDEKAFTDFLGETGDVRILRHSALTMQEMQANGLSRYQPRKKIYVLWNAAYPWRPRHGRAMLGGIRGREPSWYIDNLDGAPVIIYRRCDPRQLRHFEPDVGSISLSGGSKDDVAVYDRASFMRWYRTVVVWIHSNGRRQETEPDGPWYLPDAWRVCRMR